MATAVLRRMAGLAPLRRLQLGRLVERVVRLDNQLLADMGVSRREIAALKF